MYSPQENPHTKMSAFSGASHWRISQETMVTMFSHPSSLTRLCPKRCSVISNMINITILREKKFKKIQKQKGNNSKDQKVLTTSMFLPSALPLTSNPKGLDHFYVHQFSCNLSAYLTHHVNFAIHHSTW